MTVDPCHQGEVSPIELEAREIAVRFCKNNRTSCTVSYSVDGVAHKVEAVWIDGTDQGAA